ncbi:MAG: type II RES/Xre toxin-antitoxin system antitoxin [Bacteroidia bacterium]
MINTKKTSTSRFNQIKELLGRKYIKSSIESPFDFIIIANKGINAQIIINFRNEFKISRDFTAELLNISEPTVYRWIRNNKKLERDYSVKLFELSDLFLYGIDVFGSRDKFFKWLELQIIALGGLKPKELLTIPGGISKVKDELGRIEHGVFA